MTLCYARTEFHFTVDLPYDSAAPLFGALAEQKWAPDFKPVFLYPDPPADQEGMVFRVAHPGHSSIWVNTVFDLAAGRVQYVYMLADLLVTRIDIHITRQGESQTGVQVAYERTALRPAANRRLQELAGKDAAAGPEWQTALNSYAAKAAPLSRLTIAKLLTRARFPATLLETYCFSRL